MFTRRTSRFLVNVRFGLENEMRKVGKIDSLVLYSNQPCYTKWQEVVVIMIIMVLSILFDVLRKRFNSKCKFIRVRQAAT